MLSPWPRTLESFALHAVATHATAPTIKSRRARIAEPLNRGRESVNNIVTVGGFPRSLPKLEYDHADQQDEQSHSGALRLINDRRQRDGPTRGDEDDRRDRMSRHSDPIVADDAPASFAGAEDQQRCAGEPEEQHVNRHDVVENLI